MTTPLLTRPQTKKILAVDLLDKNLAKFPLAKGMTEKLISVYELLSEQHIPAIFATDSNSISLEWANNGIVCNFSVWPKYGMAQFVSYSNGNKVYSKKFASLEDFNVSYYEVLNEVYTR